MTGAVWRWGEVVESPELGRRIRHGGCRPGSARAPPGHRPPVEPQHGNRLGRQGRRLPKADEWPAAVAELISAEGDAERALERLWRTAQVQNATVLIGAGLGEPVREREPAATREVRCVRAAVA